MHNILNQIGEARVRRRDFLGSAVVAATLTPFRAAAQKPLLVIGYLGLPSRENISEQFE